MISRVPFSKQFPCILFFTLMKIIFKFIHNKLRGNYFFSHFVVSISGMDFMAMTDDKLNSDSSGKELILTALLCKQLSWKPPWKKGMENMELKFSMLYGDIFRIVENWSFQLLFLSIESFCWIQYQLTSIVPKLKWTNVIQH